MEEYRIEDPPRPDKCPFCGSVNVRKGRFVPRKKLGVKTRRWVCGDCGSTWY